MVALPQPDNRIAEQDVSRARIIHGDALVELRKLPTHSVDSIVTDPPYGLGEVKDIAGLLSAWIADEDDSPYLGKKGFMGKEWDAGVPGPRYWREALRVLKHGGHLFAFSSTRTYDLLVIALRLAGFEIRDQVNWIHGQGFPKSTAIDKKIDRMKGAKREVVGANPNQRPAHKKGGMGFDSAIGDGPTELTITAPATIEAQQWNGFGTALKPAHEPIVLARAPLAEKSIAANVLRYGTGGINIDASRVGGSSGNGHWTHKREIGDGNIYHGGGREEVDFGNTNPAGKRWPANVLLSHSVFCQYKGVKRVKGTAPRGKPSLGQETHSLFNANHPSELVHYSDADGMETVPDWQCAEGCPIAEMDRQSGNRKSGGKAGKQNIWRENHGAVAAFVPVGHGGISISDEGGASRYFTQFPPDVPPFYYCSKPSRAEKNRGCEGLPLGEPPRTNSHPTVKPTRLLKYLISMITPPNGVCLDFFAGSGTTGVACIEAGFDYILIEQDASYVQIAQARIAYAEQHAQPQEQEEGEWECADGCMVKEMDRQSGIRKGGTMKLNSQTKRTAISATSLNPKQPNRTDSICTYGDEGGASRFFQTFPPSLFDLMEPSGVEVEDV